MTDFEQLLQRDVEYASPPPPPPAPPADVYVGEWVEEAYAPEPVYIQPAPMRVEIYQQPAPAMTGLGVLVMILSGIGAFALVTAALG